MARTEEVVVEAQPVPKQVGEKESLVGFLDQNRAIMIWKTEGMTDEAARMAPFASDTSMIGLLQHLAVVEMGWFESFFAGRNIEYPFDFESDRDAEFHHTGDETLADAIAMYTGAVERANAIIAAAGLDDLSAKESRDGEQYSLRWIVIHMIEETARHAGHADILREHLDGTLGYLPFS